MACQCSDWPRSKEQLFESGPGVRLTATTGWGGSIQDQRQEPTVISLLFGEGNQEAPVGGLSAFRSSVRTQVYYRSADSCLELLAHLEHRSYFKTIERDAGGGELFRQTFSDAKHTFVVSSTDCFFRRTLIR